jgi:hypothetical protein
VQHDFSATGTPAMRIPTIHGVIDRRILVNYRVDPDLLASLLPAPFRPKVIHGVCMAGICLIRLKHIRPTFVPKWIGISSENAAHRAAVVWHDGDRQREGVYIRRRDTSSWLNALAGGRLFPGIHHHAKFRVRESPDEFEIDMQSDDRATNISLVARRGPTLPRSSVFGSLDEANAFFYAGTLGYSATSDLSRHQGLELRCRNWRVEPLVVDQVRSSFFDDVSRFPSGTIEFDCALVMRDVAHQWHAAPDLCCAPAEAHGRSAESVRERANIAGA